MSAHYDLLPLSEILSLPDKRARLEGMRLTIPVSWEQSRHPTPREVQAAVADLVVEQRLAVEDEFHIRGDDLDAILAVEWDSTFLSIRDYALDRRDDVPHGVSFLYGEAELVVTVAERLARVCGPMVLTMDWAFFTVVEAGTPGDVRWAMDDF